MLSCDHQFIFNFSFNLISNPYIELINEEGSCDFTQLQTLKSSEWPHVCRFSLQVFFAARKAYRFLHSIGGELPSLVKISTQKDTSRCPIETLDATINICKIADNLIPEQLNHIAYRIYHEMAHLVQSEKKDFFSNQARLKGFQEDHANLLTYLLSGQLSVSTSHIETPVSVYNSEIKFGWRSNSKFESYIALTTSLIDALQFALTPIKEQKEKVDYLQIKFGEILLRNFLQTQADDDITNMINQFSLDYEQLLQEVVPDQATTTLQKWKDHLIRKNFDNFRAHDEDKLDPYRGYTVGLITQAIPAESNNHWRHDHISIQNQLTPEIEFYARNESSEFLQSLLPLKLILVPNNYGSNLTSCLNQNRDLKQDQNIQYQNCLLRLGESGIRVQSGVVLKNILQWDKANSKQVISYQPYGPGCSFEDSITGLVFNSQGQQLMSFPILLRCF